jgi:8-oxo-dGTP pyrophosphatase MutT (NUDIX family)
MGGMVTAGDSLQSALERETWEEAGIALSQLEQLCWRGCVATQKPDTPDDDGGYVIEKVDWYQCLLPDEVRPINQDGEVAQFALMDHDELRRRLQNNEFTIEASLILVQALGAPPNEGVNPLSPSARP